MIKQIPLKMIPSEYKFKYLRVVKDLQNIDERLKDFFPSSKEDEMWLKGMLDNYQKLFSNLEEMNSEFKSKRSAAK